VITATVCLIGVVVTATHLAKCDDGNAEHCLPKPLAGVRSPKNDSFDDTDNSTSSSGIVTGNSSGGDGTDADKPETAVVSQNSLNATPKNGSSAELKTGKSISKRQAEREAGQGNNTGVVTKVVTGTDGPRNDASTPVVQDRNQTTTPRSSEPVVAEGGNDAKVDSSSSSEPILFAQSGSRSNVTRAANVSGSLNDDEENNSVRHLDILALSAFAIGMFPTVALFVGVSVSNRKLLKSWLLFKASWLLLMFCIFGYVCIKSSGIYSPGNITLIVLVSIFILIVDIANWFLVFKYVKRIDSQSVEPAKDRFV